ncbi:MAG: hypothetical protein LBQ98_02285 [Nitrososphaerota archaeon]|nr:hypothetical protein [Nitrososphaerota archaeon]
MTNNPKIGRPYDQDNQSPGKFSWVYFVGPLQERKKFFDVASSGWSSIQIFTIPEESSSSSPSQTTNSPSPSSASNNSQQQHPDSVSFNQQFC